MQTNKQNGQEVVHCVETGVWGVMAGWLHWRALGGRWRRGGLPVRAHRLLSSFFTAASKARAADPRC